MPHLRISLAEPYLLFMGGVTEEGYGKTGYGIVHWRRERCAGQMRLSECRVDLGLPELDVAGALAAGVRTAIVGVAPNGGRIEEAWIPHLAALARAGIDIAAGMHTKLVDDPRLTEAAREGGSRLVDVRVPPTNLPVGTGIKRLGKRVLTVGTDCAIGKKYTALALHRELVQRGASATFRATGQTGIMIAGEGIPIDAVVADFISGAAELLSPDADPGHWDVIEGQGSLLHPSYAGVSLGLLHGSQPDAVVMCHDATRQYLQRMEGRFQIPDVLRAIDTVLAAARLTNPKCSCVGISVNTSRLDADSRAHFLSDLAATTGLPCVDPIATGMGPIANVLLEV